MFAKGIERFIAMAYFCEGRKNPCYTHSMSTINQQSVREEAKRIKAELARLAENKKISGESEMLFQNRLVLINLLIASYLIFSN